ncbi:zinc finger and SCAN domain-containing protein 2-like isoform X2 [Syngnathoides biaculeatus]|nr:zinc finger and SCAN domain-containing protein 2-like isoform X2 [Syngnathoides biaculeatus]XP_061663236.1 zinc finger and SCAN domain-containing protein 2-like isoform X2 [Syngnathoides biaculeatus]
MPSQHSVICSEHFTPDSFTGGLMSEMGFKCKKKLKPGSVPTIHPVTTPEQVTVAKRTKRELESAAKPGQGATGSEAPPQEVPKLRRVFVRRQVVERGNWCKRHVKMCTSSTGDYEEELWGPKEEKKPQRELLGAVFNLQPQIVLLRSDITENLRTEWQEPEPSHIKEEMEDEEAQHIKEEEEPISIKNEDETERSHIKQEEEDVTKFPSTYVPLKSEDGQSEESRGAEPPSSCSSQPMTKSDGHHDEGSHLDGLIVSLSEHGDMLSDSPDLDVNGQCKGDLTCHTENKHWKCSHCGKMFAHKSKMKCNLKIHTGLKDFTCLVCGQRFTHKANLKSHTRTRTGEKPFSCSVCSQRFTHKANLTSHTSTHSGEKRFSCSICGQRFSRNVHLKYHTNRHW